MHTLPKLHTYAMIVYDWGFQIVKKHFIHDLSARPQHETNKEDYQVGGGENDIVMGVQNFGDDE